MAVVYVKPVQQAHRAAVTLGQGAAAECRGLVTAELKGWERQDQERQELGATGLGAAGTGRDRVEGGSLAVGALSRLGVGYRVQIC